MVFGLILVAIGAIFLLQNLEIITGKAWEIIWPVVVILLGVGFLVRHLKNRKWRRDMKERMHRRVNMPSAGSQKE